MPPRKKQRLSSQGAPTPSQPESQQPTPTTSSQQDAPSKHGAERDTPPVDQWTDDQETSLLKGIIRYKPAGMHKHFRMLAISDHMKSQGYALPSEQHTRIPGIWKKLGTLYNLEALDEREDPFAADSPDEVEAAKELYRPFKLPEDEFGELMFERRLAPEGSSSPSATGGSRRGSTVADTDEPRSSPAPSRGGRRGTRSTRATTTTTRGTRSSRLQVEVGKASPANEEDAGEDGDEEEGEEEGTDAGKEESEAEEGEEETGSTVTRSTRAQASRGKAKKVKSAPKRGKRR